MLTLAPPPPSHLAPHETWEATTATMLPSSPALAGQAVAYEQKYLVSAGLAAEVARWAEQHLTRDIHSDPLLGYQIESLYLDTAAFDVYHRVGRFATRKYRIRRYGEEGGVWLERKRKRAGRVRKQRDHFGLEVLDQCAGWCDQATPSHWFEEECALHGLQPVCEVRYRRHAWGGNSSGPLRLTIDHDINARRADGWRVGDTSANSLVPLLPDHRIVELKFCDSMPTLFRRLLQEFPLHTAAFSKYRNAVEHTAALAE